MAAHTWFNRIWYGQPQPPFWLVPLSLLYAAVTSLRRRAYAKGWLRAAGLSRPVIVVGNLSVGGTGKTPLVCWLVQALAARGFKVGIVTRGYGGAVRAARLLRMSDDAESIGDEPLLLSRRTAAPVAVGRDRAAAAQLLIAAGCDVIVSDDGLQHYGLKRNCELVVIDGERRFGNGRLLPAGPLREGRERLRGVAAIVVNGGAAPREPLGDAPVIAMQLEGQVAHALAGDQRRTLQSFAGESVHAVAGIGNPQRFFDLLEAHGINVLPHPLPDHARLSARDIRFGDGHPVLMTEKDAVKCAGFAGPEHWYVPVSAHFVPDAAAQLLDRVLGTLSASWR
jgi:tetraacyldisaccharide 4'-kinase